MELFESEFLELKEIVTPGLKKEIVAFANSSGGEIYIGIKKTSEIVGVADVEFEMERISNMIRDGIKPDLSAYSSLERINQKGKDLIRITVSRGERRPYHLADKGLKPGGVYVRHGITSAPASEEAIRQMIKESDGTAFDKARALNQDLSFSYAEEYFKNRKVAFTESNKKTLGLITSDGYYTNAAWLLSDQCEHSIKCAVYKGVGKTNFQSRKEFFGSILKQVEDTYTFILLNNNISSDFEGLYRVDTPDYPDYAIREALLNTVVHRDYDYSGSTIINIYADRMEFISLGGLVKGITLIDIMSGVSQSRNSVVAAIFYRLELIESYGTGIGRILESYENLPVKVSFAPAPASFVVTLPNVNTSSSSLSENTEDFVVEDKILNLFKNAESITRKDVERVLGSSQFPAIKALQRLIEQGKIQRIGKARSTRYILNK
ncbi:MAG: AAA family ATPase [Clostridiales bacterium]|nr:AAA family ATPase [Clostridiales bacterium]